MYDAQLSNALAGQKLELSLQDRSGKIANFYAIYPDIVAAMQEACLEVALETQALAFELCALDTGFMRDHIRVVTSPENTVWEIGWQADDFFAAGHPFYPMYVVLGTRFVSPRDPLTPAHEAMKPRYTERVAKLVQEALMRRQVAA